MSPSRSRRVCVCASAPNIDEPCSVYCVCHDLQLVKDGKRHQVFLERSTTGLFSSKTRPYKLIRIGNPETSGGTQPASRIATSTLV